MYVSYSRVYNFYAYLDRLSLVIRDSSFDLFHSLAYLVFEFYFSLSFYPLLVPGLHGPAVYNFELYLSVVDKWLLDF